MSQSGYDYELKVVQSMPTISGEGKFAGTPCVLVRLSGCNFKCSFCDTSYSQKYAYQSNLKGNQTVSGKDYFKFLRYLKSFGMDHLLLTGGEPFMYRNNDMFWRLLSNFEVIEIETNGSLLNEQYVTQIINGYDNIHLNISPKLNDDQIGKYYPYEIIRIMNIINESDSNNSYIFKFVYDQDLYEDRILDFIMSCGISEESVYIMALTPPEKDKDFEAKYLASCKSALKFCMDNGFRYSPRLHVHLFGADREESI